MATISYAEGALKLAVASRGDFDASELGIAVVTDDLYGSHRYPGPSLAGEGASESFANAPAPS